MSDTTIAPSPAAPPTFREALAVWLKIGLLSFGGPAGQIALMHKMLVEERRWISESRFLNALNYCMLLPGPEAQQLAIYIGWLLHGMRGGLVAGVLFVLPGFFVILALSTLYALFQNTAWMGALFFGLKAAVLAVVLEAVLRVAKRALKNNMMIAIAGGAFVLIFVFGVPFPLIIALAAAIGWFGSKARPDIFKAAAHGKASTEQSVLDQHLDLAQASVSTGWLHALRTIAVWGALWIAPLLVLGAILGSNTVFTPISVFFSKMSVVTFGGAYAVLAYVAQQAVEHFRWLAPGEMLDGLAMAETTPGPLILVLVYVGFLAAFRDPGAMSPLAAGVLGATVTTWVTFVPCFLWIFLGAPYIERLRHHQALSGALAAVTAAVVGVILNLAIWFALHTLFRKVGEIKFGPLTLQWPVWATVDIAAVVLAILAMIAMFRFKLGMIPTLVLCGCAGMIWRLFGA